MQLGNKYFVRTDYKVEGQKVTSEDFNDHLNYLKNVAKQTEFFGGGFKDNPGGMIIFAAKDLIEAQKIAEGDPLIKRGLYRYKLVEWEIVLSSH